MPAQIAAAAVTAAAVPLLAPPVAFASLFVLVADVLYGLSALF